jgi:hypothetical protein
LVFAPRPPRSGKVCTAPRPARFGSTTS